MDPRGSARTRWHRGLSPPISRLRGSRTSRAGRITARILQATVGSVAQPAQLAAAVAWLLSEDSANVNGAILPSDGRLLHRSARLS